jgi:hypothetical protein
LDQPNPFELKGINLMSNQDFNDVPDSNPWNTLPGEAPQAPQPVQPEPPVWPEPSVQPVEPEPFVTEPATETVFTSEPAPAEPEAVIYDPVRDDHEPYVDVKPGSDGFESAPSVPKGPSIPQPPVQKKKMSGWVIALIVLLVLCVCLAIPIAVVVFLVASGQYTIEWTHLINSALSLL